MKWRLIPALLMWLVLPGCSDVDRDLPSPYRTVAIPEDELTSSLARERGRVLFQANCALCHGVRGDGHGQRREGLDVPPRDFTNPEWRQHTSPRHVFFVIREGVAGTPMPAWRSLSERDAWDLTAFVLSIETRQ
jgi:cytochrome c oxidase cbb3-type subunit III